VTNSIGNYYPTLQKNSLNLVRLLEYFSLFSPTQHEIAVWNGFSIGAVCSRLEPHSEKGFNKIYIMTIGVIPAYRRRGIGNFSLFSSF
jgi:ribosomal protein S18 acetylase RimI-like enzyme